MLILIYSKRYFVLDLQWNLLGRSYKSLQPKLIPVISRMTNIKEDYTVFTKKQILFLFQHIDSSSRTIYRLIKSLQKLNIINPEPIQGNQLYDKKNHLAITYKLNKELLKQLAQNPIYKKTAVKTFIEKEIKKEFSSCVEQIIKHEAFGIIPHSIYYQIMNNPEQILSYLSKTMYNKQPQKIGFWFNDEWENEVKEIEKNTKKKVKPYQQKSFKQRKKIIDDKLKKFPFQYGKIMQLDWRVFLLDRKSVV